MVPLDTSTMISCQLCIVSVSLLFRFEPATCCYRLFPKIAKNQLSAFTNRSLACQEKCRVATRKSRLEMFAMGEWPWPLEIEAFTILQRFRHITIFSNPPYARVYFRLMNKQTSLCSASYVRWQHDTARIRPPLLQECRTFPLPDNSPTDKSCRRTNPLPVVKYKSE